MVVRVELPGDAVQAAVGVRPQIKWTNDVLLDKRKICGILTEAGFDADLKKPLWYITGIGINFSTKTRDFPAEIRDTAGSIYSDGESPSVSRNEFIAVLISQILSL